MSFEDTLATLKKEGWNISQEFIENAGNQNVKTAITNLLNIDLKYAGISCLHNAASKEKSPPLLPPLVLQISNIRNVAAPKANEESQFAPRMLKITLTDGKGFIQALEMEYISSLSLKTAPGTKIKIVSEVSCISGYYLLHPSNISVLGGVVDELYKKWKRSKEALKYSRGKTVFDGKGPPPWVPFGQGIVSAEEAKENFRALADITSKPKDDKFKESRKQVVSKLTQESSGKVFGGGQQMLDTNVQKILNAGFTVDQAHEALNKNKNNLEKAIWQLKRPFQSREEEPDERPFRSRGRGRRGGRQKREVSGPDGSDDESYLPPTSRPSGLSSLCDFLDLKSQKISKGIVYEQQLRELNRYSKAKNLESQGSSYQYEADNSDKSHPNKFVKSFQDQSYQNKYSENNYESKRGRGSNRGNKYGQRGTGNYNNKFAQRDTGNYDNKSGKNETGHSFVNKNPTGNDWNQKRNNYEGKAQTGSYQDDGQNQFSKRDSNYSYQSDQYATNYPNRRQTGNYRGDNRTNIGNYHNIGDTYNKKDNGRYHKQSDPYNKKDTGSYNKQSDTYTKKDTGSYYKRGNAYNQDNAENDHNMGGSYNTKDTRNYQNIGDTSNQKETGNYQFYEEKGKSYYGNQQSQNNYYPKGNRYNQGQPSAESCYNRTPQQSLSYSNQRDDKGPSSSKRVYTDEEQALIGQFRQSLEISGDYQSENYHSSSKTGDYYREGNTDTQRRNQYGREKNYGGTRGQSRGYGSAYQGRY